MMSRTGLPRTVLSLSALGLLGLGAVVAAPRLAAQVFTGHDTSAPVDFKADRIEMQNKENRVVLTGNVDITQTDLRLRAQRTVIDLTKASQPGSQPQVTRITASGDVTVTRPSESATGDTAIYDFNKKIITMVGNASLKRSTGDTLHGGRFVMDLNSGVSSASGGRVSGTFNVPKKGN